ncbi:ERF family protein [Salinisphaera sp.]|uniref:ERF family protein n=1 Tax=Salinisphaera sp. TaxID=1914330 RepID=UPI000C5ACF42|nr:ERF family protein [Salinisphaera sp.]MAS09943.1 hypothetical protein [Salinisphaera sp.]|tara:strand:- start:10324 stop:11145 length:822 start_codon:yes stop_codon:yes gene_type:complete
MTDTQPAETGDPRNLLQRLNAVREHVAYIKKDLDTNGYSAVSHDAVTAAVRPAFIDEGVMVLPTEREHEVQATSQTTRGGTPIMLTVVTLDVRFANVDDPEQTVYARVTAQALDHGDKGPGKAWSYAVKTAMLKVLSLETGENDESRVEMVQRQTPITAQQYQYLSDLLESAGRSEAQLIDVLKRSGMEIEALTDMTEAEYGVAVSKVEDSIRRQKRQQEAERERAEAMDGEGEAKTEAKTESKPKKSTSKKSTGKSQTAKKSSAKSDAKAEG